jgi:hypothetical protein
MARFRGGLREVADHHRPWVRLDVTASGVRLAPWFPGMGRYIPDYVIPWEQLERVEPLPDAFRDGPAVRFVLREPVPAKLGAPNAGRWPPAQAPVFLCGSLQRMQAVLAALGGRVAVA